MRRESKVIELWPAQDTSSGIHLLVEWFGCDGAPALLREATPLRRLCLIAAESSGLRVLADVFRQRAPAGVIGTLLMAESHLTIHTWPNERSVALDVFVGMQLRNNRSNARTVHALLRDALLPDKENFLQVHRGGRAGAARKPD